MPDMMKFKWIFIVRGLICCIFGLFLLLMTDMSVHSLALMSAAFVLVQALALFIGSLSKSAGKSMFLESILSGVVGTIILLGSGLGSLLWPSVSLVMLPLYLGSWALITGVFALINAIGSDRKLYYASTACIALLWGIVMILRKDGGALIIPIAGAFSVTYGAVQFLHIFLAKKKMVKI